MKAQNYASNTSRTPLSQRIISIILSVMMLLGNMTPVAAMADEVLVCTQTVHAHDASCYERQLTCGEAEREAVTHSVRTKLACTFEGHKHTDECRLNGELICGVSTDVYHKHDDNCYAADGTLACGMDEVKQHRHGDDCYDEAGVLTCKRSHEHTSDCFYKDEQGRKIYTCGQTEIKAEHQHSGACWVTEAVVDDLGHQHVDACYTNVLICTVPEHQHSASCYEDVPAPTAEPTVAPTAEPTAAPTEEPTEAPTEEPTEAPTEEPTEAPTEEPTEAPTEEPTEAPAEEPTEAPAEQTVAPLDAPDFEDIVVPTAAPARKPLMAAPRPMMAPAPGNGGNINMTGVQFDDASTLSNGSIGATFNADIEIDLDVAKTALWGGNDSVTATIGGISVSDDMCGRWYTGKATGFSGTPYYFTFEKNDDGTVNILYQFTPEYIQAAEAQQATRLKGKMGYSCTLDEVSDKEHGNAIITVDGKRVEAPVYDEDPEDNKYFDKEISTTKSASVNRSDDGKTLVTYTIDVTTWNGTPGQVTINDVINQNDLPAGMTMTPVSGQVQYVHGTYENNGNSAFEGKINESMILSTTPVTPTAGGFNQTLPALPAHDLLDRGGWSSEAGYGYRVTLVYDATAITASGAGQMVNNNVTASSGTGPSNIEAHGSAQANLATSVNASKNAEFETVDGQERARIKWTISIDNNGVTLADKVLKDDMFPGMNASDISIKVKGSGADGSSHWTFNNSGSTITTQNGQTVNAGSLVHDGTNDLNSYEITYYTDLPAGQRWPDAADVRTNNFDFNDKPGSKSITITPNTISTGKNGQLAGDRSYIEWTITITNDHKDISGQQLLDAMIDDSAYGFTYVETSAGNADASSKWKKENGKLVNQASSPDYGSYKITYRTPVADPYPEQKVTVVNDYTFLGEPGHSNGVDINPGTVNPGKDGVLADDRSKITWTLTLNNDHADLQGVTITDPMLANATLVSVTDLDGTAISGAWEIHTNDDGSKVLLNLKTEKDNNSYIITYTTPVAESDRYPKDTQYVTNSGHIAKWDKYFSDTVEIPGETDAVQGVEKVLTDNTPVTDATGKQSLTWTGTIHLNAGLLRADTVFGDRMYYATDYNQQEQPQQHYMTGAELKRVTGVIVEKLGGTCDVWAVQNNQTVYFQNIQDDGHYTGFGVKVTADKKIASAQDIEFTYNTVADFGSASDVVKYFRNGLRVNNNNEVTDQWKHTTTLIKQDGDGKNVDTYPELNKDNKTLKWKIAYTPSQTGLTEVTLIDTLPEHVTIKEVSAQNNNLTEGQERDVNGVKFTWTTTTGDDGRQSVSVLMKKSDGLPTDTIYFVLTCEAQDLEELTADWEVGTKDVVFDASNSARVVGDGELPPVSQTQHVKYEKPVPPPAKVADKSYYYDPDDDTDHLLHYSVQINPNGETLNKGKALKLTDVLAYQNGYTDANHAWYDRDIVLDASSVKLYYAAVDDDGNVVVDANGQMIKGNAVSPTQWNMSTKTTIYNDPNDYNLKINGISYFRDWNGLGGKTASDVVERDITFTVPDARPLVLEYAYKVTMTVPKVDGKWQEVDLGVVANSVTLNGATDTVTTSGDKYKVSDAWSNLGDQHVYKVERGNQANSLDGATFVVYRDSDDGAVKTYVTKNGGFDLSPDDYAPNTIYYFEETQAPVGYVKADDRVYFYWSSGKAPSALTSRIEALREQGIVVHDLTKSNEAYYAENDKLATSTKVTKKWDDNNDENGMRPARITAVLTRFAVPDDVYATLNVEQSQQEPEKFDFSVTMYGDSNPSTTSNPLTQIPEGSSVDVTVSTADHYGHGVAVYVGGVETYYHFDWNSNGTMNFTIPNVTSDSEIALYVVTDANHNELWHGGMGAWTVSIENGGGGSAGGKDFDAASWAIIKGYRDNNYQGETAILSAPLWAATWDDLDTIGTMVDANGNTVGVHYVYDVSEVAVNGYKTTVTGSGTTEDGFEYTLENKYTGDRHEPTTLSVKKEWSGIDSPASSVQIKLLRKNLKTGADELYAYNGSTVHTVVGGNTFTFKNLPYKVNGEVLYSYAVIEVVPEGATFEANYYVEQNGVRTPIDEGTFVETPDTSIVLVNAKKEETTTAAVTKEWDMVSGEDWPEGITVNAALYQKVGTADATVYDTQPLTADKPTYSWSKLPKKVNGATATYYVVETTTLDGYTTTYNGQTDPASQAGQGVNITITNTQKTTSVKAKKSFVGPDENGQPVAYDWPVDANGQPITITLRLTRNGEEVAGSDKTTNSVDTVLTWTNLPKLDADGEEITYSVIEVNTPAGFVSGIAEPDEDSDDDVIAIVNKTTALLVTKVWKLNGGDYTFANGETLNVTYTIAPKAGTNTPAVKLTEDNFFSSDLGSRVTLDSDTQFTVAYTENAESVQVLKLPVGEYTITESTSPEGWTPAEDSADADLKNLFSDAVTFTNEKFTTSVRVNKQWKDTTGAAMNWPDGINSITVTLKRDGSDFDTQALTAGELPYTWPDLDKINPDTGEDYVYTVEETAIPGYTTVVAADPNANGAPNANLITNTYAPGATTATVWVKKVYKGNAAADKTFSFSLYRDNPTGEQIETITITGEATNHFAALNFTKPGNFTYYVVEEQPTETEEGWVYDENNARPITISVEDDGNGGLVATVQDGTQTNSEQNPVTFTNTYQHTQTKLYVKKTVRGQADELEDYEFEFELLDYQRESFDPPVKVSAKPGETVSFEEIDFYGTGTFGYYIREIKPADAPDYITYDEDDHAVIIRVVKDPTTGALSVSTDRSSYITEDDPLEIVNTYRHTQAMIYVKKTVDGMEDEDCDLEFEFELLDQDGKSFDEPVTVTVRAGETAHFPAIDIYSDSEWHAFFIRENKPENAPSYIAYDDSVKHVMIDVYVDADIGDLHALVCDIDNDNAEITETAPMVFTNTYEAQPDKAVIWVKKVVNGIEAPAAEDFVFELYAVDKDGNEASEPTGTVTITGAGTDSFAELTFDEEGTYTYHVKEVKGTTAGWKYDKSLKEVTITVADNGAGQLTATVKEGETVNSAQSPVTFTNTYQHTQATIYVKKTVEGNADELKDHEFEFELLDYRVESFNPPVKVKVKPGQTVSFPAMDFYTSGTYGYYVREIKPDDAADHITYDEKVYSVLVLVEQDTNGALYAQVNLDAVGYPYITEEEPLEIVNKYQHIEVPIYVTKTVDGLTADQCDIEFEFQLLDVYGEPLGEEFPNVKIKAGETGSFGPLEFYAPLEFTYGYIIREIKPDDAPDYITYSNDYEVNLDVTEDEDTHQLVARVYAPGTDEDITEDAPAEIVNTYVPASVDADLYVQKIIEGANAPATEKFTFELYKVTAGEDGQSKDEMVDTLQMTGADTGKFTVGSFDEPGTYTYKVKERDSHAGGWTYDTTVYTVTVEVTDDKTKHELVATVKKADGSVITDKTPMTFTNTYAPEETVAEVWVKKVYTGSYAPTAAFGFYLYEVTTTTGGAEVETLVNQSPAMILVRDGMASILTNTFDAPGTYVYRVKEMLDDQAGWTYDKTVKEVTVEVTDNGDGTMTAVVMDGGEENTKKNPVVFTNEFTPASATIYAKKEIDGLSDYTTCPYIFDFELLDGEDVLDTISVKAGETDHFETLVFSETGTFTYTIHEIEPDNAPEYVTYSAVYTDVVIVVSEDPTTHALSATVYFDDEQTEVTAGYPVLVTNIYKPTPVDASIWVKKAYAGENAPDETFEFKLYEVITTEEGEEEEQYIAAKTITGEGTATFDMNYDEVGEHTYHVKETNSGKTGWTYDTTVKTITVKVSDDLTNHSLVAEVKEGTADNSEQNPAAFSNTFAPATATIWAKKTIDGMDDSDCDAEFEFELLDENKQRIDGVSSITVTAGGKGAFQTLYFNESDKTYVYYVHEVQPENKLSYIDYDDTYYAVTVETATDADTNTLTATVVDADQADVTETTPVVVTNTYVPGKTSAEIYVEKIYEGDNTPTRAKFTFGLYLVGEDGQESSDPINTVTITGEDTNSFHMAYDEPGTYTYHVKEMPGTLGGWVYDTAVKTVTVTVVDNNDGTMTATVKEDTAANNVNNPVTFTNSFTPVTAQISVKKTMSGIEDEDCGVSFEFRLLDWNENPVEGVSNVTVAAGQTKQFAAITFNEEGTYTYYVQEIKPADAPDYITYDTTPHEVVIEVSSDETTNALIAQVFVGDDEITAQDPLAITNTYQPAETSAEIYIKKNYSGSRMPTGSTFTFSLYEVDKDGNEAEEPIRTKTITGATQGSFDSMTYDEPGTYTYHVKETIGTEAGWSYDATVKTVTVTVTDNKSGSLVAVVKEGADVNNADNPVTFTNLFTPVTAQISVQKAMNGIADEDCGETFEFQLLDPELNPLVLVENVKIKAGETGSFVPFTFNKVGSYPYYLQEIKPDNAPDYITYDETPYLVTVVVSRDETTNALKAQVVAGENEITAQNPLVITNTYTAADAKATVWVKKAYTGKNPPTETFEFTLYSVTKDADGKNAETKVGESITITGQETASFSELSFSAEGTYTYKVKETITDEQTGWSSTGDKTVTITVTDNHDGTMTAVVKEGETTVTQSAPVVITNNYDAGQAKAKIWVEKTYDGDDTDDEEFTFALYTVTTTQSGGTVETLVEDLTITGEDKAAFSELVYTDAGTYTYKVKEVNDEKPGWTYDERFERTVTVTVTDNGKGSLSAVVKEGTATVTEDAPVTFVNEYTTTQITVQKTWTGYGANGAISMTWPNPDAKITFELHRVDADGSDTVLEEVILTADVQSKTWTLPDDGSTYYAVETKVENVYGFTSNVNHGNKDSAISGGTIAIKNTQQFVSKQATKSWTMLNDQITWPEGMTVTIDLLRDGEPFVTGRVLSATSRTWTFYNLPKIDPLTGEDYVYTVAEKKIQYYGLTVPADWFTVTENGLSISNAEQSTAITAAKAWINEDGTTTWPKDENGENLVITLNLFRVVEGEDDLQVGTITLNGEPAAQTPANVTISADGASVTWSKLPKYIGRSSNGTVLPCTYYVTETGLDGYETYFDLNSDPTKAVKASGTIAVQNIQLVDITARKAWVNADQSTTWPTLATGAPIPVTFHLLRNGVSMGADYDRTITSAQDVTWTDLRAGNAATGETYTYTVSEDNVKSYRPGSIVKGDDGVFTVTNTQIATSVTAEKVWQNADGTADGNTDWPVDADGTPVTVTLHLLRNGVQLPAAYDRQLAANGDTAIWLNLPEQDDNGDDYVYTVDEDAVPGYDKQITQNPDETWTITNAQQQTSLTARKAWVNAGVLGTDTTTWPVDESGAPVAVTLHLLRDGSDMGTSFQKTVTTGDAVTWSNLPAKDLTGRAYVYSVSEDAITGYDVSFTEDSTGATVVTNTEQKTSITAAKAWVNDDASATWPVDENGDAITVTLTLHQVYGTTDAILGTVTLDADNQSVTWSSLPAYKFGKACTYYVTEAAVDSYITTYQSGTGDETDDAADTAIGSGTLTVTNTNHNEKTTSLTLNKRWIYENSHETAYPDGVSATFHLEYTDLAVDGDTWHAYQVNGETVTYTVNADNGWSIETGELPFQSRTGGKFDYNYQYKVVEDSFVTVDGTESAPDVESDAVTEGSVTLTNVMPNRTSINVKKVWDGGDHIPGSITVTLMQTIAAGEEGVAYTGQATVTAKGTDSVTCAAGKYTLTSGDWTSALFTFSDLPRYDTVDGQKVEYKYYVVEESVDNYVTTYSHDASEPVNEGETITVTNTLHVSYELPLTGGSGTTLIYLLGTAMAMLAAMGLTAQKIRRRKETD